MLQHKHFLRAAAMACMFLAAGSVLAVGPRANYTTTDARLMAHIPATAQAVVIIHDMASLDKKIALLAQNLKIPVLPPSLRHIEKNLNLPRGIDAHGTAAIVVIPDGTRADTAHTVMILPTKTPAAAITNMNFSTGKDGLSHGQSADGRTIYAMAGKKCIMVSHNHGALLQFKSVSTAITPILTESEVPLAEKSDVYVVLNVPALRKPFTKALLNTRTGATDNTTSSQANKSELKTIGKKVAMQWVNDTHSALLGLRISRAAITLSMVSHEKPDSQVAKAIDCLRPLAEKPLMGLPGSTRLMEAAASNIDGKLAARFLDKWAMELPGASARSWLPEMLQQLAALIKPITASNTIINVSSHAKGPLLTTVGLAESKTPAATALLMQHLLVSEASWVSKLQFSMGTKLKYRTSVVPNKVTIGSIPFTVIKQSMALPAAGTPDGDAMRNAMKMQQELLGNATQTYFIGSNDTHVIVGGNSGHKLLAGTVKASSAGSDALDSNPQLMAADKHIVAGASLITYLDLSPFIAAMAQRVQAMANINSPMPRMSATEPMSISVAVKDNILTGQWRMPMKNLEQLSTRIHALLPLVMMMEMQSMQGGQGGQAGANPPQ